VVAAVVKAKVAEEEKETKRGLRRVR